MMDKAFHRGRQIALDTFKLAEAKELSRLIREIVRPKRGADGLIEQPDDVGAAREKVEFKWRMTFVNHLKYADDAVGDHRTFDPKGNYNCGRCNQADDDRCLLLDIPKIDRAAGSCSDWEDLCAADTEQVLHVKSPDGAAYGVAANGKGFGCHRCPYASKAKAADSKGRDLYCGKGGFRVQWNACCAINGAKTVPYEKTGASFVPIGRLAGTGKQGSALGANAGVMPRGDEQSHGSGVVPYPERSPSTPPDGQDPDMSDWLWNISDLDHLAPGRADGSFGQETIG